MDKLFKFSKVAAIIMLATALIIAINSSLHTILGDELTLPRGLHYIDTIPWLILSLFGILLTQNTTKGSPIRLGSIIIAIVCAIEFCIHLFLLLVQNWGTYYTIFSIFDISMWIDVIGIAFAFIWISRFFQQPLLKTTSIIIALFPLIQKIIISIYYGYYLTLYPTILTLIFNLSIVCFFFAFSKLNQSK
ncbi:MAG: hypothetical protein MJZ53_01555 [Paludibacteraceae bacterium]|nr:hypothetical protein [Paludibacteraceae bacterium]